MKKKNFSVLLLTFNEEVNIKRCLDALSFSNDVLIVDSYSTDRTIEIAKNFDDVSILQNKFENFSSQRNYGLDNYEFKNDVVIHLDADEVITAQFLKDLKNIDFDLYDCVDCPSRIILNGKWLKYSSSYPVYQTRIAKTNVRFTEVGHGQKILGNWRRCLLKTPYDHYNFSHGLRHWFAKHAIYAEKEANEYIKGKDLKSSSLKRRMYMRTPILFRPFLRFIYLFLIRKGFLDGISGIHYCAMMFIYEFMIFLMVRELQSAEKN